MTDLLIPALVVFAVLSALARRVNVYEAFVQGAREGLETLLSILPYLAAILTAVALLRGSGAMDALTGLLAPLLNRLGIPEETAGVILLRPLSGSAAMGLVEEVMKTCGADSRAGRLACIVSGASETIFFTSSLYLGAAGVKSARYAIPAALIAYVSGVLAAAAVCG